MGAVLHSVDQPAAVSPLRTLGASSPARYFTKARKPACIVLALAALALSGCGNNYRPVVSAINPVGPAGQPSKFALAISSTGANSPGLITTVDYSGDTIVNTTTIGVNPYYLVLNPSGGEAYTLNGNGTINSFPIETTLLTSDIQSTTSPVSPTLSPSLSSQGTFLYVAQTGLNSVAEYNGTPPAIQQQLPTGPGTVYTVTSSAAPRVYAIAQGASATAPGNVSAIETTTNTISTTIPVGIAPVYGVMTADARRAFILNKGSNTVSVINAQTNAPDTFTNTTTNVVGNTIPVGTAPVWADFAPTYNELLTANAGTGTTPGSVTIISIPLCSATTVTSNPACDVANPVDAVGFGTVVANIPVGINPVMIAVLQDGTQAFVANAGVVGQAATGTTPAVADVPGSVSVINLATNTVIATIPAVTNDTNALDSVIHGHPNFISVTTGNPYGKGYVTATGSNDLTILRSDLDSVQTHLSLQGQGMQVRVTAQ